MTGSPNIELYIDGKPEAGQTASLCSIRPMLGTVPTATIGDLDDAIAAAECGFKVWRRTSPAKHTQIILKAASLIREGRERHGDRSSPKPASRTFIRSSMDLRAIWRPKDRKQISGLSTEGRTAGRPGHTSWTGRKCTSQLSACADFP